MGVKGWGLQNHCGDGWMQSFLYLKTVWKNLIFTYSYTRYVYEIFWIVQREACNSQVQSYTPLYCIFATLQIEYSSPVFPIVEY